MKIIIQLYAYINIVYNYIVNCYPLPYNIYIIKDSIIIQKFSDLNGIENLNINWDYLIYIIKINNKILVSLYLTFDDIKQKYNEIEPCNFEFIFVTIKMNDNNYDITEILKNNQFYYYVNNNILFNEIFMNWLFTYHLKLEIELEDYSIILLDNNATEITINNTQFIKLNKNDYEIITK